MCLLAGSAEDGLYTFSRDSRLYAYEWKKKTLLSETYLREKVDYFSIENFGDLENKVLDGEYRAVQAFSHKRLPLMAVLTEREEIIILDSQKGKVTNYLVSHYGAVGDKLTDR